MWPDAKQADMHSTWEQPFPLNSYKLAFTYFYKWKNNICVYIEGKKQHTPTWQAMGTPKSSSLPEFHLHTTSRFEHRTFLWSQGPRRDLYQWMAVTLHGTPSYILPETRQNSHHNLKFCQNYATLFSRYIACQKSQHTLKLCKNNATFFWGYIRCQKVIHTLNLCKNNEPTCAGLTHTSDSNSTLDRCQQAGWNFVRGQYISNGSLLQTVQPYPLLSFSLTAQLGHIFVVPKHKFFVSYYKRFCRVMDTNRTRLCLLVSITGGKCVWQEPIFLSGHHPSICQKLREGIPRCRYRGRL
jgi:hypothetical protein